MKSESIIENIETLAKKASEVHDSGDTMRFSQAACNVANAFSILNYIEKEKATN